MDSKVLLLILLAIIMSSSCVLCSSWIVGVGSVYAWRPRNCTACSKGNKRKTIQTINKPQGKPPSIDHVPPPPPPPSVIVPTTSNTSTTSIVGTSADSVAPTVASSDNKASSSSITGFTSLSTIGSQTSKNPAYALPAQYEADLRRQLEAGNATNTNMDKVAPWNVWQFDGFQRLPTAASGTSAALDIRDVVANTSASGTNPTQVTGIITLSSMGR